MCLFLTYTFLYGLVGVSHIQCFYNLAGAIEEHPRQGYIYVLFFPLVRSYSIFLIITNAALLSLSFLSFSMFPFLAMLIFCHTLNVRHLVDGSVEEKVLAYNRANREVAVLCNHQRSAPKTHEAQMDKLGETIDTLLKEVKDVKAQIKAVRNARV